MAKVPIVDREKCIGCGTCVSIAPDVFELGPEGKSQIKNPTGSSEEMINQAIASCPVQAISWNQ